MKLSIVIPAYNEEQAIRNGNLYTILAFVFTVPDTELILVDDGSTDQTHRAAMEAIGGKQRCYVYRAEHTGKAGAILTGVRMALGDMILVMDMDLSTPIFEVHQLIQAVNQGADIAIGSRGLTRVGAPVTRYALSLGQMILKRALLGLPYIDTQCGFKLFQRTAAIHIADHLVIYHRDRLAAADGPNVSSGFDVEFLLVAQRLGYQVVEVPVDWMHQQTRRVRFWRDARRGVMDLFRILAANAAGLYPTNKKLSPNMVRTVLGSRN